MKRFYQKSKNDFKSDGKWITGADIEKLNYERYAHPNQMIRKRIFSVYLKIAFGFTNRSISLVTGIHYNLVGFWVKQYKEKGFDILLTNNYGTNKSELEEHLENISISFQTEPVTKVTEAVQRIIELTGIVRSEPQVRAFMKRHGLKFIKK